MSCEIRRIAARGPFAIEEGPYAANSLSEAAVYERPGGVYAAFGTWHDHRVIRLSDHFDRLEDSARRLGFRLSLERALVCAELCEMMHRAALRGARIRVSAHPDDFSHPESAEAARPMLTVAMEEYTGPPKHLRERGVSCRTLAHSARENPRAKQTSWLADRSPPHEGSPYEWLLLDENDLILEGASSNFYAVISAPGVDRPELRTAGAGVLYGIARSIVLEVAPEVARVVLRAPSVRDLPRMQEAFITSASRGIVPVARIDGRSIGSDTPGDVTRGLISRYDTRAAELEEPLCASDSPRPVAR